MHKDAVGYAAVKIKVVIAKGVSCTFASVLKREKQARVRSGKRKKRKKRKEKKRKRTSKDNPQGSRKMMI
jgi:U3 small nucleolar ribonucleoprotein component